ncbi:Hypothetical predicted protein [Scomber scombrus]|uniref:Uncharacterized protein n=1 Tax=Scomber scombrus TaxID=13677 RepID=A0AAV1PVS7_SCOSC
MEDDNDDEDGTDAYDGNDEEEKSVGRFNFGPPISDLSYQHLERLYHLEFVLHHLADQERQPQQPEYVVLLHPILKHRDQQLQGPRQLHAQTEPELPEQLKEADDDGWSTVSEDSSSE